MRAEYRVKEPLSKPLLIFDGECKFCRFWAGRWLWSTGDRVEYAPSQAAWVRVRLPEIPPEAYDTSVQLVEPDGSVYHGAEAALRSLATNPKNSWMLRLYYRFRVVARISEWAYRVVSNHRPALSVINRWLFGKQAGRHA